MSLNKKILIVSSCQKRGDTAGLTGAFLSLFNDVRNKGCRVELYNIGFFNQNNNPNLYNVDQYWMYPRRKIEYLIRKIPGLRSFYAQEVVVAYFKKILRLHEYNLVVLYQVPHFSDKLISISHSKNIKVMMYPWGSDILRVSNRKKQRLLKAFSETDYVMGNDKSNALIAAKEIYKVSESKIVKKKNYPSGIREIMQAIGRKKSRDEMMKDIGLPRSNYNIVCGYNAAKEQRHHEIIDAVIMNKRYLPKDYLLVFPVSYSGSEEYINELREKCANNGLNVFFIRDFISNEKMAYLHIVTDLFIQIQPTDCGSAFMMEALYAKNRIVTGKWLNYIQFEQFGTPYHLIDNVEDLGEILKAIFAGELNMPIIPQQLIDMYTIPQGYRPGEVWEKVLLGV